MALELGPNGDDTIFTLAALDRADFTGKPTDIDAAVVGGTGRYKGRHWGVCRHWDGRDKGRQPARGRGCRAEVQALLNHEDRHVATGAADVGTDRTDNEPRAGTLHLNDM